MASRCAVPGCSHPRSRRGDFSHHSFPVARWGVCKQWLAAIKNPRYDEHTDRKILEKLRVCSEHFITEDFQRNMMVELMPWAGGKRKPQVLLKPDAVPSVFSKPGSGTSTSPERSRTELIQDVPDAVSEESVSPEAAGPDVPLQSMPRPGASATVSTGVILPGGGGTAWKDSPQTPIIQVAFSPDSEVAPTTFKETECSHVSELVREMGSSEVLPSDEETAGAQLSVARSESGSEVTAVITVTSQPAGEASSMVTSQPAGEAGSPVTSQLNTMKVEVDYMEQTEEEVVVKRMICSAHEGSGFYSMDIEADMVENMDGGTDQQIYQEVEKEEEVEDKRTIVRQDTTDSKSSTVNAGPAGKDDSGGLKNGVRRSPRGKRVEVKDEPVDEEYDKALQSVKDEPETAEDNLKISAVFSVGSPSTNVTTASPVLTTTQLSSAPTLAPPSMYLVCFGCKKMLTGVQAFRKKGSSHLYCSTKCLTSYSSSAPSPLGRPLGKRTCCHCLKEVLNSKDLIKAPDPTGTINYFCGQTCLSSFNVKRNFAISISSPSTPTVNTPKAKPVKTPKAKLTNKCAVCKKPSTCYSHEVVHQGVIHKLDSDVCFKCFCSTNQLSLNCTNCGGVCQDEISQMRVSSTIKSFCNAACQATYKQKNKSPTPCTMCRKWRPVTDMVEFTNSEGLTELYCTAACVTALKVKAVSASGAEVECETCKQKKVPAYHLAMSDSTIKNFCTLTCILTFQEQFKANKQKPMAVVQTATVPPPAPLPLLFINSSSPSSLSPPAGGTTVATSAPPATPTGQPNMLAIKQGAVPSSRVMRNVSGGKGGRPAMAKRKTRGFFTWTDEEVELLLKITLEYKEIKAAENLDWESVHSKYTDILERYRERYPSVETLEMGKAYPHKKDELTKDQLTTKLKAIRFRYRQAVDSGKKIGHGRVVMLCFELCESIWGGFPATREISEAMEAGDVAAEAAESGASSAGAGSSSVPGGDGVAASAAMVANRRQRLNTTLSGYRRDRLKRKLSTDSVAQEDLDIKRRLLQRLEATDDDFVQTMVEWSSTIDRLNSNIELLVQHIVGSGATEPPTTQQTTSSYTPTKRPLQEYDSPVHEEYNSPAHGEHGNTPPLNGDFTDNTHL